MTEFRENNFNILIVDDTPENLSVLSDILDTEGYRVRPAISGPVALKSAKIATPDLILLDILMPGMDGFEVCRQIRADRELQDIPVIFISALDSISDKMKAFQTGGVDFVSKPFQAEEILARVRTHLHLRRMRKRLEDQNLRLREEIRNHEKTEKALRESEVRFRTIYENAPVMINAFDDDGRCLMWNGECVKVLGFSKEEISTHPNPLSLIYPAPEDVSRVIETIRNADGFFREWRGLDKQGAFIDMMWANFRLPGGEIISIGYNVTEQKKMEARLLRAKEMAEAANRTKSEFIASMSHEIRTPLNAILGFCEIVKSETDVIRHSRYLETVLSSGKTLLELINDILDLSKIEAGHIELTYEPVDIRTVIRDMEHIFIRKTDEKGIVLTTEIAHAVPSRLMTDEIRIRQILINIIGNAVKFTREGRIRIRADEGTGDPFTLSLEVEDTGIGIPEDQQKTIFKSFRQQAGQKISQYGGTGLGLSISRRLARMMGGDISVRSVVGRGSRFRIELQGLEAASEGEYTAADRQSPETDFRFDPATVLVVDDSPANRELSLIFLKDTGLSVREAETAEEALSDIRLKNPDLVLTNVRLSGMSGIELARSLQESEDTKDIPVIALTASHSPGHKNRPAERFAETLIRPVSRKSLLNALAGHLPCTCISESSPESDPDAGECSGECPAEEIQRDRIPELIKRIETDLFPMWEETREMFFIDEIALLAANLTELGKEFQVRFLEEYGIVLKKATEDIQIDTMEKMLNNFPELIRQIKTL